ncbi:unnamed protein product [Symbiodinium pilosum]|uniref:Uncharacterized protein n=1 Tax=Symbiodinium pilosum TaxID=2952 RepID=A0A812VSN9_SYMPI|nr:unnamed protein product [Symbiodinium pilosum]
MVAKVVDANMVDIRSSADGKNLLRLGNTGLPKKGDAKLDEEARSAAKAALEKKLSKSMIWWKAAPPSAQRTEESDNVRVADVWTIEGEHIPSYMIQEGHLLHNEEYAEELARDILSVAAGKEKQEQYQALEQALRETQAELQTETSPGEKSQAKDRSTSEPAPRASLTLGLLMFALVCALFAGLVWVLGSLTSPKTVKTKKAKKG